MFTRFLLVVILAIVGAQCASAGVLVRAEQTPESVGVMSWSVDDSTPLGVPAVEKGDAAFGITVISTYTSVSAVAHFDASSAMKSAAPLSETIRVWSATLPTCPFLEAKLKPA